MAKKLVPKRALRILGITLLSVGLFAAFAYFSINALLPMLPKPWRTSLIGYGGATIATITFLAALVQIAGISLRDLFASSDHQPPPSHYQQNGHNGIILGTASMDQFNFQGEILQSSTKIVVENAGTVDLNSLNPKTSIEQQIREIQTHLFGENNVLPYTLTLCSDLCERTGLATKYNTWIRSELKGYDDELGKTFPDEASFEKWLERWAAHRSVQTYIKFGYRAAETGRYVINNLPFVPILVGYPVAKIVQTIQAAKEDRRTEFGFVIKNWNSELFNKIKRDATSNFRKFDVDINDDLQAFYSVQDLDSVLNGVRNQVLSLLAEVRKQSSSE